MNEDEEILINLPPDEIFVSDYPIKKAKMRKATNHFIGYNSQ